MVFTDIESKYHNNINYICKPFSFEEVDEKFGNRRVRISSKHAEKLGIFTAKELQINSPMDYFGGETDLIPNVFIVEYAKKTYLVNTEGYDYCRYVARCDII